MTSLAAGARLAPVRAVARSSRASSLRSARVHTRRAAAEDAAPVASDADAPEAPASEAAASSATPPSPPDAPRVVVIGASGKTGRRCVSHAASKGLPVVACTRSGAFSARDAGVADASAAALVASERCDVSKASAAELATLLDGAGSCIFAASASPSGGSPWEVDKAGLVAVARACLVAKVPRLVIVSSGSVSKPLSSIYAFLNLFGGIMRAKIEGEDAVRALYFDREGCDYVVVRPGGLTEDEPRGVAAIELNQGDDKSGRIARADVAAICVEAAERAGTPVAADATFECYWADTGKSLGEVGLSNALGGTTDEKVYASGRERRGNTWDELFEGLDADAPGVSQQGWGPSL